MHFLFLPKRCRVVGRVRSFPVCGGMAGGSRFIDGRGLCCVAVERLGLAEVGVDVGLLGDDVNCRGRIGLGDG